MFKFGKIWLMSLWGTIERWLQKKKFTHAAIGVVLLPVFYWLFLRVVYLLPISDATRFGEILQLMSPMILFAAALVVLFGYYMREVAQAQVHGIEWREIYLPWRWRDWDKKQTLYLAAFISLEAVIIWLWGFIKGGGL